MCLRWPAIRRRPSMRWARRAQVSRGCCAGRRRSTRRRRRRRARRGPRAQRSGSRPCETSPWIISGRPYSRLGGSWEMAETEDPLGLFFLADDRVLGELVLVRVRVEVANLRPAALEVAEVVGGVLLDDGARPPGLAQQLVERAARDVDGRILVELGARGDLRTLGFVGAVTKHIAQAVVGILQQREVSLTAQADAALRLLAVFQLEEPADDLFLAAVFHRHYT